MDFLDPKKKQAHRIKLFVGYGLIAIAIVIATIILALVSGGYGYDRDKGAVIQNGLVFVNAHPESATMYINGEDKGSTDGRFVLEEGSYNLELRREGYRTWKHDFTLEGASIERFVYPFLFPQTLTTKDVQVYDTQPDLVTVSPDRHWIVTHHPSNFSSFTVIDSTTDENTPVTITVPASIMAARPASKLEFVEWSTDNRHLLLRHVYEGGYSFLIIDRQNPAESVDVTATMGRQFTQVSLRDKRFDQLYAVEAAGTLERIDLKSKAVTTVAPKVLSYFPYGDSSMLYVTDAGAETGKVLVKLAEGTNVYTLRSLPQSPKYVLNMAEFDGQRYVAAGSSVDSQVYLYLDPMSSLRKTNVKIIPVTALLKLDSGLEFSSFSNNARFFAIQGGSKFAIYDAETKRQHRYDTTLQLAAGEKAIWMDGHRLCLVSQAKLHVFDFDGTNSQELNAVFAGITPMFDRDYEALFTLSPSVGTSTKPALVRAELLLN